MASNSDKIVLEADQVKSEEMSGKIREILKSNGITDPVSEVIIKDAGLQGEGFASITKCITVKFENPEKKLLNLFVKQQTENSSHTEMLSDVKAFEKEAMFLTNYCQAAKEMCTMKGYPDFIDFYPKCYYGDGQLIVLENLVLGKGYSLKSKEERQDMECAVFSMKTLAKHHAIGYVMINENGGAEQFFTRFRDLDFEYLDKPYMIDMMSDMCNNAIDSNVKILEKNNIRGAKATAEKLKGLRGKPKSLLLDSLKNCEEESPFLVLGHGAREKGPSGKSCLLSIFPNSITYIPSSRDYWNNNMMFLVDHPTKKIVHHVAIDFQLTRYNTPALDLSYYLFSTVHPNVRRSHLLELLNIYKETFNKVTAQFGYPTNLTLDTIFKDYRLKAGHGFWYGLIMNVGPGMSLFEKIDISKMDIKDWPVVLDGLVNKWIEENPEKGKETAEELIQLVDEYEYLRYL